MNAETLSKRQLQNIIDGAADDIADRKEKIRVTAGQMEKNLIYCQIKGRESIIKRAGELLKNIPS